MKLTLTVVLLSLITTAVDAQKFEWVRTTDSTEIRKFNSVVISQNGFQHSRDLDQQMASDNHGNVVTIGRFFNKIDIDPGTGTQLSTVNASGGGLFIQKFNSNGNLIWAGSIYDTSRTQAFHTMDRSIACDQNGNIFISGNMYSNRRTGDFDFDPSNFRSAFTVDDNAQDFILKLDSNGIFQWVKTINDRRGVGGGPRLYSRITVQHLNVSDKGDLFLTGHFIYDVDFDPDTSAFHFESSISWLTRPLAANPYDIYGTGFLLKLDNDGKFQFVEVIGRDKVVQETYSGRVNMANASAIDQNGDIVLLCSFFGGGYTDMNPGSGQDPIHIRGKEGLVILKLDSVGGYKWGKKINSSSLAGTTTWAYGSDLKIDSIGSIYTIGSFFGTVDFDPKLGTPYVRPLTAKSVDIFISKLDKNGNYQWAINTGGIRRDYGLSIFLDDNADVYATGSFCDTVDFDPSSGTDLLKSFASHNGGIHPLGAQFFIHKLDSGGNHIWARTTEKGRGGGLGSPLNWGESIFVDKKQNIFVHGHSQNGMTDFNFGKGKAEENFVNSAGDFVLKLSPCDTLFAKDTVVECDSYKWINGITYFSSNPNVVYKERSMLGCDSIITLNLTIKNTSFSTDTIIACDSAKWIDGFVYDSSSYYQYTKTLTNAAGCDSIVYLYLTVNNSILSKDSILACNDYTWSNGVTYTSSNYAAKDTLPSSTGCDSVVTLNLTIKKSSYFTDSIIACDSLQWINGVTYYTNNSTAKDTLVNVLGCDSIISLNLNVNRTSYFTDSLIGCNSLKWIDGVTYFSSNYTAKDTFISNNGCDSIISLNLTIYNNSIETDNQTACDKYKWIDGITYLESNQNATEKFITTTGCDSVVKLDLEIRNSSRRSVSIDTCAPFIWIDGNEYTKNDEATYVLENKVGCDSIIELDLIVDSACYTRNEHCILSSQLYPNPSLEEQVTLEIKGACSPFRVNFIGLLGQSIATVEYGRPHNGKLQIVVAPSAYLIVIETLNGQRAVLRVIRIE